MAALGFWRMSADISALGPPAPASPERLAQRVTLTAWKDHFTTWYLAAVAAAIVLGRLRALALRRSG